MSCLDLQALFLLFPAAVVEKMFPKPSVGRLYKAKDTSKQISPLFGLWPPRRQPGPLCPLKCVRLESPLLTISHNIT